MAEPRKKHIPELDQLKGLAILSVILIHAKLFEGTVVFEYGINRAVPVFLVLFGVTSELWWRGAELRVAETSRILRDWYKERLARLVPPVWAVATAWWLLATSSRHLPSYLHWPQVLATYAGYSPWIGPSWFVTMILQLVLLLPLLRWFCRRVGPAIYLPLSAIVSALCVWYLLDIIDVGKLLLGNDVPPPGWYYQWIFPPRVFWHVTAGVFLARWADKLDRRVAAAAVALVLVEPFVASMAVGQTADASSGPLRQQIVEVLFDVPLAVALLGTLKLLRMRMPRPIGRFLAWCGLASWGIYLGHMLVHDLLHWFGHAPEAGSGVVRALYALLLFAAGAGLTVLADGVRRRFVQLAWHGRQPVPIPRRG